MTRNDHDAIQVRAVIICWISPDNCLIICFWEPCGLMILPTNICQNQFNTRVRINFEKLWFNEYGAGSINILRVCLEDCLVNHFWDLCGMMILPAIMCQKQFNSWVRINFIKLCFNENGTGSNKVCKMTAWSIGFENHTSCHINGCKHVLVTNQQPNIN